MRNGALPAVLAVAVLAVTARGAVAEDITLPFQAPDRVPARRLVEDFDRLSKAGDWPLAADRLQQLLDFPADDPVVIRRSFIPARFEGASFVARRLFDALPPEGRAAWERNSRERAEELLSRGLRLRREPDLREAARRFPAADVRRRAFDALAQLALVRADLAAARFHLAALYDACDEPDRALVLARRAWVAAQQGDAEELARVRSAAEPVRDTPVPSGLRTEPLGTFVDRMIRAAGPQGGGGGGTTKQFGGDAHGNGLSDAPPAPESPRWQVSTEFQDGTENDDENPPLLWRDRARLEPVVPLVSHGLVFVNSGLSLIAVNLSSGTVAWRHDAPQQEPEWRDSHVVSHTVAVADGAVYAALATRSDAAGFDRRFYGHTILYPLPHRALHAFDERTGDLLWSHETSRLAPGREDAAEITKECVSSPPLVVGDDLIVTAWTYEGIYDVRAVCYDRRTGRTRWRTSLVQGQQELNLFGRPVKELVTGAIAESAGRLFFATGLGVAAAVEREDGRIAWLSQYTQTPIPKAVRWHETRDRDVGWWPSPVSASPLGVVMAPVDAPALLCFDPASGLLRWSRRRVESPNSYRWFLGTTGGRAYVLGTRLAAIDIASADGRLVWTTPDAGRLAPPKSPVVEAAGRGILTKERVYVPTDRAVVVLSAASGVLEETWPLVSPIRNVAPGTGNLVSGEGALLFVTRSRIDACFRFEDLRAQLESRLAQSPDDPQVRLDAGEAYAAAGRLDTAIETLEGGFRRLPQLAPRVRDRLDVSLRRALHSCRTARAIVRRDAGDLPGAADDLRAAVDISRDRGDAVRALLQLAQVLEAAGRPAESEMALRRIATEFAEVVTTTADGERAQAGALALFLLGDFALRAGKPVDATTRWLDLMEQHGTEDLGASDVATRVRESLKELAKTEPDLVAAAVRTRAKRAFETAKASRDLAALDRAARLYPDPEFAAESALLAAELHLAAGRPRDAVGVLSYLLGEPRSPEVAARALWKLAAAYRALGETARERSALRRLAAEAPDVVVLGTTTAADAVKTELASARFHDAVAVIPDPRPPLVLRWQAGGSDQIPPQAMRFAGSETSELAGRMLLARAGVVTFVDSVTGRPVWEQSVRVEVRAVAAVPGAIVVCGNDGASRDRAVVVLSLAFADGRELWRKRLPGQYRGAETALGVMYVLTADGGARTSYGMSAISIATGELLASRAFDGPVNPMITVAEDGIVVTQPTRARDGPHRTLVTLDGTNLSLRGRLEMAAPSSPFYVHPSLSSVVVTTDQADLVAVDLSKGDRAWKVRLEGRAVKAVFHVPSAVIVSDDADAVRRLDAETGREIWQTPLAASGSLVYQGEAAEGDLVVATLKTKEGSAALAVGLDAATGAVRWRTKLDLADENTYPHPEILGSVVAYELNERLDRGARSRVVLLDRTTGEVVQTIEHPTISKGYQRVIYGPDWLAVSSANELAVYGTSATVSGK